MGWKRRSTQSRTQSFTKKGACKGRHCPLKDLLREAIPCQIKPCHTGSGTKCKTCEDPFHREAGGVEGMEAWVPAKESAYECLPWFLTL